MFTFLGHVLYFVVFFFVHSYLVNRLTVAGWGAQTAEAGAKLRFRHLEKRAATEGEGGGAEGADPGAHKVYIVKELGLSSCLVSVSSCLGLSPSSAVSLSLSVTRSLTHSRCRDPRSPCAPPPPAGLLPSPSNAPQRRPSTRPPASTVAVPVDGSASPPPCAAAWAPAWAWA